MSILSQWGKVYGIEPQLEHYGCMVDLYGRAGRLYEALNFINNMPLKPHFSARGALLNACRMSKMLEKQIVCIAYKTYAAKIFADLLHLQLITCTI